MLKRLGLYALVVAYVAVASLATGCASLRTCEPFPFCTSARVIAPDYGPLGGPVVAIPPYTRPR